MTGTHITANIFCCKCSNQLGWTYVQAFREDTKYKIGMFVLEKALISKVETPYIES